jgi:hypothetical protein
MASFTVLWLCLHIKLVLIAVVMPFKMSTFLKLNKRCGVLCLNTVNILGCLCAFFIAACDLLIYNSSGYGGFVITYLNSVQVKQHRNNGNKFSGWSELCKIKLKRTAGIV